MIQDSLFPEFRKTNKSTITVKDVARDLNVSEASVRNWIKTGYLEKTGRNEVSLSSFNNFKNSVAGKEKLTSRANKSLKDSHDHQELVEGFQKHLSDESLDVHRLAVLYEESLSNSYKNKEGVYYTPSDIVDLFFDYLPEDCSNLTICDPCCGTGNFLIGALKRGFRVENIFGFDTDHIAIEIAKKRILAITGVKPDNIVHSNFLDLVVGDDHWTKYDVIFTNPPWGKKLKKSKRERLASVLDTGNSKDTSAFFFFACLKCIEKDGYLGLLLQDAFFNIATFEDARRKALSLDIKGLIDFGKPFKGLVTKAKGIILQNRDTDSGNRIKCESSSNQHQRSQSSFIRNPKSILNFSCSPDEAEVVEHLLNLEHINLEGKARYGLGIVTGNNKKYCISQPKDGYMPVYRGADIQKGELNDPSSFIPSDLSLYQQVAPIELYQAKEKLIYKFISSDLVFYLDTKQRFFLNSVNMLILDEDFPISAKQLGSILNSQIINWFFKTVFETHKVLRSDIEALPIHIGYFEAYDYFSEEAFLDYLGVERLTNGTYRIKR